MKRFTLIEETLGYWTDPELTNTDVRYLVSPSQNIIIDRQRKASTRGGYSRLGAANTAETPVRSAVTWNTSTGTELPLRVYDDELEVYIGTKDAIVKNAWFRVMNSLSTTEIPRFANWWYDSETLDVALFVQGDDNLYQWNGAVVMVQSVTANTITKEGTNTFAQERFYTTGNKTLINVRTGTEFTYTGGETTTTLTGITGSPVTDGMIAGDVLVQKVVTNTDEPAADRNSHTIYVFENQVCLGSNDDNEVYLSKNDDVTDYTFSAPRVAGEGALLTLDGPSRGISSIGKTLVAFAGNDSIFAAQYTEIAIGGKSDTVGTLAEALSVKKVDTAPNQGSLSPDCVMQIGDALAYMSNEPALRMISNPEELAGIRPKTLSNPIKPDFDGETFTNVHGIWHKNSINIVSPVNSKMYILEFVGDADGKLRRFWQPPQVLPLRALSIIDGDLYGHSNAVPETYKLFDTNSDISSTDDKLPIQAIAAYAYQNYGDRKSLKGFDEYFVEGEVSPSTKDLVLTLNYDFGGFTQSIQRTIDATDNDIIEETLETTSLAQQSLAQQPLGGSRSAPSNTAKFRVIFEIAKEDFHEIQPVFSTNETDRFWSIIAHGANARVSPREVTLMKK